MTHVLDRGTPTPVLEALLVQAGDLIGVIKVGWGIGYVDRTVKERVALCHSTGIVVSLGGTLLEVAVAQGRLTSLRRWAEQIGVDALEVSNGLQLLSPEEKSNLVRELAGDFTVLAEMEADLAAGARWVIAEGRDSGTVGLYRPDGSVRDGLVDLLAVRLGIEQIIEAPQKAKQAWLIRRLGPGSTSATWLPRNPPPRAAGRHRAASDVVMIPDLAANTMAAVPELRRYPLRHTDQGRAGGPAHRTRPPGAAPEVSTAQRTT